MNIREDEGIYFSSFKSDDSSVHSSNHTSINSDGQKRYSEMMRIVEVAEMLGEVENPSFDKFQIRMLSVFTLGSFVVP